MNDNELAAQVMEWKLDQSSNYYWKDNPAIPVNDGICEP